MGELEFHSNDGWQVVQPGRLQLASVNGLAVPVPCLDDQLRLFKSFGRDKDLRHAAALRALVAPTFNVPVLPPSV